MSVSTPILAVLSWAKAGAAMAVQATAISAAVCRARVLVMAIPPHVDTPRRALLMEPCRGLVDRTVWFPDSTSGAGRQCAYGRASAVSASAAQSLSGKKEPGPA